MAAYFLDSSAIVKRYVLETGSAWINGLVNPTVQNQLCISQIASVEVAAALARKRRDGTLPATAQSAIHAQFNLEFISRYTRIAITESVLQLAVHLVEQHPLRAYDAVQLATALALNRRRISAGLDPLTFVCSDRGLLRSATAEGLLVEDPNSHAFRLALPSIASASSKTYRIPIENLSAQEAANAGSLTFAIISSDSSGVVINTKSFEDFPVVVDEVTGEHARHVTVLKAPRN